MRTAKIWSIVPPVKDYVILFYFIHAKVYLIIVSVITLPTHNVTVVGTETN